MIEQDVLSVADADAAVSWGPGLRWAIMGPNLQFHVGGGAGGIKHFLEGVFAGLVAPVQYPRKSEDHSRAEADDRRRSSRRRPEIVRWNSSRRKRTSCWLTCFGCVAAEAGSLSRTASQNR